MFQLFHGTKTKIQSTRFIEQKLVYLFHYCTLMEELYIFLKCETTGSKTMRLGINNIKAFFIRDIIYFMCNTLMDTEAPIKLKQAICCQILRFFKAILPKCAQTFGDHLNIIVSALLSLCRQKECAENALACLRFLIIEQKTGLAEHIALLDNFPSDDIFTELRNAHIQIKYDGMEFSLAKELQYFLKIEKRKIEGLAALREHVRLLTLFIILIILIEKIPYSLTAIIKKK